MRIAIDATAAAVQHAGVGRYTRELAAALVGLPGDDEFILASAGTDEQNRALLDYLPPGQRRDLKRLPLPERWLTAAWQRLRVPVPVDWIIGDFDVFHGVDFAVPPSDKPRVVTIHDLSFLRFPGFADRGLVRYLRAVTPRSLRAATRIVTVSAAVAAELVDAYPWALGRVVAVPNGVRIPTAAPARDAGRPTVLIVGTVEPRKNMPGLIQAMSIVRSTFPDAILVIAGRVGWRSREIVDLIRAAERDGAVRHVDAPDDEALEQLYAGAAVVAYPSFYEGFGLPVLEAMARGIPVVASAIPSLQETAGDAALYVDPHDPESIAAAVLSFLSDTRRRAEYADRGRQRARRFSWRDTAVRTRRVYQQAAREYSV